MRHVSIWAAALAAVFGCTTQPERDLLAARTPLTEADCPAGSNVMLGTDGNDVLVGTNLNDCILGLAGNDVLQGGNGEDFLIGGPGNDTLSGGNGVDWLYGEEGNDILQGGNASDVLEGSDGDDVLAGENGDDTLSGGDGNDVINDGNGGDVVDCGEGNDVATGGVTCDNSPPPTFCVTDDQCATGQRCLPAAGVCVYCLSDAECGDSDGCTADACQPVTGCSHTTIPPATCEGRVCGTAFNGCGVPVSCGFCAIGNVCGDEGQCHVRFKQIATGQYLSCGVRWVDGAVQCWGAPVSGAEPPAGGGFSSVSVGTELACALRSTGELACWGREPWVAATPSGTFTQVEAGFDHACAITPARQLVCWGADSWGEATPPAGSDFIQVASGFDFTCGLHQGGAATCWGNNAEGQLDVPALTFSKLSAGWNVGCGLTTSGTVACWGDVEASLPAIDNHDLIDVAASHTGGAVIRGDGSLASWWVPWYAYNQTAPGDDYVRISGGGWHFCALHASGIATCWGGNWSGQTDAP